MNESTNEPKTRKYKRYDLSFKRSAVEHWLSSGKSADVVAAEMGINGQTLKAWKQQLSVTPAPGPARSLEQLQEENRRLRRDLSSAHRRCEILKKPWASSPNPAGAL